MARDRYALEIRASRSSPPGRAGSDEYRRSLYSAAIDQYEHLMAAASTVGASAQPLLLFYALSQAGRAIVAAHGEHPDIQGHGLREDHTTQSDDLLHRRVERAPFKSGTDAFTAVARATGCPDFEGSVELGAVWTAIPWTHRLPGSSWQEDWRTGLSVRERARTDCNEPGLHLDLFSFAGNPLVDGLDALTLDRYPTIPSGTEIGLRGNDVVQPGGWIAVAHVHSRSDLDTLLDLVAPKLGNGDRRGIIPTLPTQEKPLTPLMLVWLLAFGFSIYARYHPALWRAALDVERSENAVAIESVLDQLHENIPELVLRALHRY